MGGNTLTTVNGALTLNPGETVNVTGGANFATGTYVLAHYTSLVNNSSNFSGWTVNGPSTNIYTFQIDPANKDVELVARPLRRRPVVQNLYVANNGYLSAKAVRSVDPGSNVIQYTPVSRFVSAAIASCTTRPPVAILVWASTPPATCMWRRDYTGVSGTLDGGSLPGRATGGSPASYVIGSGFNYGYGVAVDPSNNVYRNERTTAVILYVRPREEWPAPRRSPKPRSPTHPAVVRSAWPPTPAATSGQRYARHGRPTLLEYNHGGNLTSTPYRDQPSPRPNPFGMAFDAHGNSYVAEHGTIGKYIYKFAYTAAH